MRILFATFLLLVAVQLSSAQFFPSFLPSAAVSSSISFDAGSQGDKTDGTAVTISHTTAADAPLMEVGVAHYKSGGGQTCTATYNGTGMTEIGTEGAGEDKVTVFRLYSPTSGTHDVVVTPAGGGTIELAVVVGTFKVATTVSNGAGLNGSDTWSQTLTVANGNWGVTFLRTYNSDPTATNGTIQVSNDNNTTQSSIYLVTRPSTSTTVQINGTGGGGGGWQMYGNSLNK